VPTADDSLRVEPCGCQGDLRRRQRIAASNIPRRYYPHCTLDTFYDKNSAVLRSARNRVREFVDAWPMTNEGRGLLLMGGCGAGKTHLAVAVLVEIIHSARQGVLFCNFSGSQSGTFRPPSMRRRRGRVGDPPALLEADLPVLDELGSGETDAARQDLLYYVINSRYNTVRPTIFTTNAFDDAGADGQRLVDKIGDRLRSRLYEMTEQILMKGVPDHRSANKQSGNIL
jgi:DNA replication protein DnaC